MSKIESSRRYILRRAEIELYIERAVTSDDIGIGHPWKVVGRQKIYHVSIPRGDSPSVLTISSVQLCDPSSQDDGKESEVNNKELIRGSVGEE